MGSANRKNVNVHDRVLNVAQKYRLDESASAQLLRVFAERSRLATCDVDRDLQELSEHLAASNKPSALVCNKLADIRSGKPLGPCKFASKGREPNVSVTRSMAQDRDRSRDRDRKDRSRSRDRKDRDGSRDRDRDRRG